ncbi:MULTISPECIES: pyridoxamine 5'-phosphate oxidase family protein [unclassified Rhizobium]|uniref:2Fe-2S iron-sulfur cluster-binding protein n=1 Tax=unclassified Rhizobium TaxID=2613769 RepID=UPI0007149AFA|nr:MULTISPECIES: pyridoxamine 5'-phosphate oxidase family protein [unclassified Rhizobium]KQS83186.1 FAD-binding oxidoreductase [Rhizobium sp. Leaf386]KQS88927.1 FAD-binding oxidoreductase [Rhizobium sp. Leaf391]KQT92775.1 FAD-binding oxidoreductase [Rhizobium sp. Leaf453]
MSTAGTAAANTSPWHAGEIALQRKVGVAERMDEIGRRVLRDHLIDQHRAFYPQLPFIVLGSVDAEGNAWATLRAAKPGFLASPDPYTLSVALEREAADPADAGMEDGQPIGMLGIELHTRRRNRLNGTIMRKDLGSFNVRVGQSYGNCPQYIQLRDFDFVRNPSIQTDMAPVHADYLDDRARQMIAAADTAFVASYVDRENGERQVDASHRGGKPGFIRVDESGVLTIPDFAGNLFFNTLGNILANGKAGLVFADFETGELLQLSGDAEVVLDSPEIATFQGAERLWRFTPRHIVRRPEALALRWVSRRDGQSPNSLMTGSWDDAAARLKAQETAAAWRPFRISRIVQESASIRSFHLEPADGLGLLPHAAGQHLPIRVMPEGSDTPVMRTYTLSTAPSDGVYRISVKREGLVSRHLHDTLKKGDLIEARKPAGLFTIDPTEARPAVLLAAGIGVTPILAMLRHIVYEGLRKRRMRPTWLILSARTKDDRAFDREIADLVSAAGGMVRLVRVLSDTIGAEAGEDYDVQGRIETALLSKVLPFNDYDFYLCGLPAFMQSLYDGLRDLNISDKRIHAEAFGPASITRRPDEATAVAPLASPSVSPVAVQFVQSAKEARWNPGSGSLLELAEARGLAPEFSCRQGTCGICRTKVVSGSVTYSKRPEAPVAEGEALICCAVPAEGGGNLQLDI